MLKAKDCPLCADIGVESKPRVGLFFGMYQVFAVCECTKCENAVIFDVGVEAGRPKFVDGERIDMMLEKAVREWNKRA